MMILEHIKNIKPHRKLRRENGEIQVKIHNTVCREGEELMAHDDMRLTLREHNSYDS